MDEWMNDCNNNDGDGGCGGMCFFFVGSSCCLFRKQISWWKNNYVKIYKTNTQTLISAQGQTFQ